MIHVIIFFIDQFGNRDNLVALFLESGYDSLQGVFCIFGAVMHKYDGTVSQMRMIQNFGNNGIGAVVLPVKTVII